MLYATLEALLTVANLLVSTEGGRARFKDNHRGWGLAQLKGTPGAVDDR
jgi:hypothetical protein